MPRIHIGTRTLQGALERYAQRFDLLEVRPDPKAPLRMQTLRRWRKAVPPTFVFTVVLPPELAQLRPYDGSDVALENCLETARILESPVIVVPTPPSVTPTAANRKRLADLVAKLPMDVVRVAWEPAGLWEQDEAQLLAHKIGVLLVRDAAREPLPPGQVVYTRLRGLGEASRLSSVRAGKIARSLHSCRDAYIVVETDSPMKASKMLRERIEEDAQSALPRRAARARPFGRTLRTEDEEQE